MKITPIDIRQQQFGRAFRGLDPREVESFLHLICEELEGMLRENNRLKDDLAHSHRIVEEYQEREHALKNTMITAQKVTDEIKESARKEADFLLSQAELQAEKIVLAANDRLVKVIEDINDAKRQRQQLQSTIGNIIEAHRKLLREQESKKVESLFKGVDDLKSRHARIISAIREELQAQASLIDLDRDRDLDNLHTEVEVLERQQTSIRSRLTSVIETHEKIIKVREELEEGSQRFKVENNLKVLKKPEPAKKEEKGRGEEPVKVHAVRAEGQ